MKRSGPRGARVSLQTSASDNILVGSSASSDQQHDSLGAKQRPSPIQCFANALLRKKPLDGRTDTNLNRCLNLLDLTALGVGSTLGLGLYVLAGQVASSKAGPGCVISFALAALASAFSALCYAEFAGRVPRAGSAYAYSYITVGEFVAFIIGWNLILEYVIGASSVARGFSGYVCYVVKHLMANLGLNQADKSVETSGPAAITPPPHHHLYRLPIVSTVLTNSTSQQETSPISVNSSITFNSTSASVAFASSANLAGETSSLINSILEYHYKNFDWPSIVIIVLITMFILFGVKESTNVTMIFTTLNLFVVLIVVLSSLSSLDLHNWQLSASEVPQGFGAGGFLPYGWAGVLSGSATCFFGFIGFDTIASSAEEAKNPKSNVPLSIILSLFISFLTYMAVAIVQTLLWPYYDQNNVTILPYIFDKLNMPTVYWIVLFGAIAGLASSLLGGMYPLPRILYSMANDKLIYSYLANINQRLKLPVRATIVGSILIALLACLLDIQDLADMVSIGTLAAYSLVSLSVLILRYEERGDAVDDSTILSANHVTLTDILETIESSTIEGQSMFCQQQAGGKLNFNTINRKSGDDPEPTEEIKRNGSKAVVAQLSVGFNSWFKGHEFDHELEEAQNGVSKNLSRGENSYLRLLINRKTDHTLVPSDETSRKSKVLIAAIVLICVLIDLNALFFIDQPKWLNFVDILDPISILFATSGLLLVSLLLIMLMLARLPTGSMPQADMFQVPLVPLVPTLSILVNVFLMLNLSYLTWVRFTVWMAFGFFIYFTYGIWNSQGYLLCLNR